MPLRCAILDDYQNVALTFADWSGVMADVDIKVFNTHLGTAERVIAALQGFEIVCAMRERTAFPREVIEALPDLKLLITTGMRNASIDLDAAKARGVIVAGTPSAGNATAALAAGLMLELARHIGYENARLKAGATWQTTIGLDLEGLTLGLLGLGRLGTRMAEIGRAFGMDIVAWSQISRRRNAGRPKSNTSRGMICFAAPTFCRSTCSCRSAHAASSVRANSA